MGTDNLFHKRKAKSIKRLQRRAARRDPYAKVLIVCEGEKTEPYYFQGLRSHHDLNTANVEVCGECGSDPGDVLRYAKQRYREEKDAGDAFDKVFCIFDKDAHANYDEALNAIAQSQPRETFIAVNSVPSFEYWLLLHFTYSTRPYSALPGNSAGNQVLSELKAYLPNYEKGADNMFALLLGQLEFAKSNAARSLRAAKEHGTDNPSTRVHELVEFLQSIKDGPL
ncbi:RloB family protein [Ectothiorhodospira variabilis]|uniref:RloB family protein n=1 Tax=Ectothiorhodospira variabilis TaxID=505694 RepID=UPI001EFADC30|nr:RloB family protein [Ectothiorhodospira variabilis]MCG5494998.1 RloB family protein [Ectothiorhodospira variabilis]MCG5504511.1 RloB family protein [Ectothiorhodospira variabilis]MCG5507623.1 RloB family protein [Ectothiorhodospira variabilis]